MSTEVPESELEALARTHRFGRYCEDPTFRLEDSQRYTLSQIRKYLGTTGSDPTSAQCIEAFDKAGRTAGLLLFKLSAWDTEHFGYPCVIVDSIFVRESKYEQRTQTCDALLEHLQNWLKEKQIRFCSLRVSALDLAVIHSLERYGFDIIESWVFNHFDTRKLKPSHKAPYSLRLATADDELAMLSCSQGAFDTQRFHADPRVDRAKADSLYEKWITTAFRDPNMRTLVVDEDGKGVAFMVYFPSDLTEFFGIRAAMWRMALLDPSRRGKGLGTGFFQSLVAYHGQEGLDIVDSGVSMRNLASLNLHNKCGFKVSSTLLTFHKWLGA